MATPEPMSSNCDSVLASQQTIDESQYINNLTQDGTHEQPSLNSQDQSSESHPQDFQPLTKLLDINPPATKNVQAKKPHYPFYQPPTHLISHPAPYSSSHHGLGPRSMYSLSPTHKNNKYITASVPSSPTPTVDSLLSFGVVNSTTGSPHHFGSEINPPYMVNNPNKMQKMSPSSATSTSDYKFNSAQPYYLTNNNSQFVPPEPARQYPQHHNYHQQHQQHEQPQFLSYLNNTSMSDLIHDSAPHYHHHQYPQSQQQHPQQHTQQHPQQHTQQHPQQHTHPQQQQNSQQQQHSQQHPQQHSQQHQQQHPQQQLQPQNSHQHEHVHQQQQQQQQHPQQQHPQQQHSLQQHPQHPQQQQQQHHQHPQQQQQQQQQQQPPPFNQQQPHPNLHSQQLTTSSLTPSSAITSASTTCPSCESSSVVLQLQLVEYKRCVDILETKNSSLRSVLDLQTTLINTLLQQLNQYNNNIPENTK